MPNCQAQHHTILNESSAVGSTSSNYTTETLRTHTTHLEIERNSTFSSQTGSMVLLATAILTLESPLGAQMTVRALVDPASEGSFILERVVQALSLAKRREFTPISGVGEG